ncbi:hypothetical protein QJS10_CPA16g00986 [Acorus calamus]|uniref:Nucleoporin Nup54 alpha-helical domain-containing protein n=1 Tax=Acorus calamus TaxID=4465 RepID=A0AAV9D235_ACOCL|nr:hypothetical protein QJS10_CPA16g00986 [Acorus calamus]
MFGTPAFGSPSTPSFGGGGVSLFSTPSSSAAASSNPFAPAASASQPSPFSFQPSPAPAAGQPSPFGFQTPQQPPQQQPSFLNAQITTQMAPVAPLPVSLVDRDIQGSVDQAIIEAYKEEPGNPKYSFKHLLFSVTEPAARVKPVGVSDIMWAEAMGKLEGMESANRERLWPQLIWGFKDLSQRLKLQDEVLASDAERLRTTQSNVKMLQRHFQAETLPWIQRMRQKEQGLQRRLLRVMRILEALEGKGFRVPLTKGEAELAEKLAALAKQIKGSGELSRRVHNLLSISRMHANTGGLNASSYLPGSMKIHEQSLADMQEVLQQQTEAIARLGNVLKKDTRDMEIIMSEDTEMAEAGSGTRSLQS